MSFLTTSNQYKAIFFILLLFTFTLPFSIKISNYLLFLLACLSVFRKDFIADLKSVCTDSFFLFFFSYYFILILGLGYSENFKTGLKLLEKDLSFIIFPFFLFPLYKWLSEKIITYVLITFIAGICFSSALLFCIFIFQHFTSDTTADYFFREKAFEYVELHPTYLAMYACFGVFIILKLPLIQKKYVLKLITLLILTSVIILSGARNPLVSFFTILFVFIFLRFKKVVHRIVFSITTILSMPLLLFFLLKIPVINSRFTEFEVGLTPPLGIHYNSVNLRVAQILCAFEKGKQNWFFGTGTGDVQDQLNSCYKNHGWSSVLYLKNYNTHNQFIQTWLAVGIPGLILLTLLFLYPLLQAIKRKDFILISLILLFSFCSLTESMFEKNKGIVFYCFFVSLLYLRNKDLSSYGTPDLPEMAHYPERKTNITSRH